VLDAAAKVCDSAPEHLPQDFKYLCTLADDTCGNGLPMWHLTNGYDLLSVAENARPSAIRAGVDQGASIHGVWPEPLEVLLTVQIGNGTNWGGSFMLWCRRPVEERCRWRYAAHKGEWATDLYDTIEEYLEFYANWNIES
jgi:hypothetical protein